MKKTLSLAFISAALLLGCSEESLKDFTDKLSNDFNNFTNDLTDRLLQGSNLQMGFAPGEEIPEGDDFELNVQLNSKIINGGTNIIDVSSPVELSKLYLHTQSERGFYVIDLEGVVCEAEGEQCRIVDGRYLYTLTIILTQDLSEDDLASITISGLSKDNQQSETVEKDVKLIEVVEGGDLQISLSWNNESDLDLYVETPSGEEISYRNKTKNEGIGEGGLDLDANAGCPYSEEEDIRNENIFFKKPLDDGEYKVYVKQYSICGSETGAAYSVSSFYEGKVFDFAGKAQQGRFGNNSDDRRDIGTITVRNGAVVQ